MSNFLAPSQSRTQKEKARTARCALLEGVDTLDACPLHSRNALRSKKIFHSHLCTPHP